MNNVIKIVSTVPSYYDINEAFKTLRTNLFFAGENVKVVTLTSADPGEGKSTISIELARSISQVNKKVLYIDADMRRSNLAEKLVSSGSIRGLSHYLSSAISIEDIIYPTQYSCLDIICSGPFPPNPVELLDSPKFRNLIATLREVYDYIIIDTPPVGSVIDASVVSAISDGVILVTVSGHLSARAAREVKSKLERNKDCRIIGAILNKVDVNYRNHYGYRQYYYSGRKNSSIYEKFDSHKSENSDE